MTASQPQRRSTARPRRAYAPVTTLGLAAVCVAVFLYDRSQGYAFVQGTGTRQVGEQSIADLGDLTLYGPSLTIDGEWFRVITSGFVHFDGTHLAVNLILLAVLGRLIEQRFGALLFMTLFLAGLLGGSLGALLIDSTTQVGGASGALFGLMGATAVLLKRAGYKRILLLALIALELYVGARFDMSLGAHVGGLIAGLFAGAAISVARRRGRRAEASVPVAIAALSFGIFLAIIPAANWATTQSF